MSDTDIAEILKLPVDERLRLLDAHRAVVDERLAEHARNPDDVLTRDQVLAEARRG